MHAPRGQNRSRARSRSGRHQSRGSRDGCDASRCRGRNGHRRSRHSTATLDVYVDGAAAIPNFQYETVTTTSLPGRHLEIRPPEPIRPAPRSSRPTPTGVGCNYSVVAHLTEAGQPGLNLFPNPTSRTPGARPSVTVRHTAAAPAVDVRAGGQIGVPGLTNPNDIAVRSGGHGVCRRCAGRHQHRRDRSASLESGSRYSVHRVRRR